MLDSISPRKLFLLDGMGALVSAFLLGVVLVRLESFFGIPKSTLYFLALLPCLFAVYDFVCYRSADKNLSKSLKNIATFNLLYCVLSLGFAFYHLEVITSLGWIYILSEILIVTTIAFVELNAAKKLSLNS